MGCEFSIETPNNYKWSKPIYQSTTSGCVRYTVIHQVAPVSHQHTYKRPEVLYIIPCQRPICNTLKIFLNRDKVLKLLHSIGWWCYISFFSGESYDPPPPPCCKSTFWPSHISDFWPTSQKHWFNVSRLWINVVIVSCFAMWWTFLDVLPLLGLLVWKITKPFSGI